MCCGAVRTLLRTMKFRKNKLQPMVVNCVRTKFESNLVLATVGPFSLEVRVIAFA